MKFLDWRALAIAVVVAATVFLLMNVLLTPLLGVSMTVIIRYMASIVLGAETVNTEASTSTLIIGVVMNYLIAAFWGFLIAIVIHRWGMLVGIVLGGALGFAVYVISVFGATQVFWWFQPVTNIVFLLSHIVFGMVLGGVYEALDTYDTEFPVTVEGVSS